METINVTTIRQLLERYHQGDTSLEEERQLSDYFCNAPLPDDLLPYRALFRFFRHEAAVMPPQKINPSMRKAIRIFAPLTAVAAMLILFFALYHPQPAQEFLCYKDGARIDDREEVVQLAQHQLNQISIRMQKATALAARMQQLSSNWTDFHKI